MKGVRIEFRNSEVQEFFGDCLETLLDIAYQFGDIAVIMKIF